MSARTIVLYHRDLIYSYPSREYHTTTSSNIYLIHILARSDTDTFLICSVIPWTSSQDYFTDKTGLMNRPSGYRTPWWSVLYGRLRANSFNFWKVGPRSSSNKSLRFKVVRIIESVKNDELMKMSSSFK